MLRLLFGRGYPTSPTAGDAKVEFAYDYLGWRVQKKVSIWNDAVIPADWDDTHVDAHVRKFIWSGWLMLLELDGGNRIAIGKLTEGAEHVP